MGWIEVDRHIVGLVWLFILIASCCWLALIDTVPHKDRRDE